MEEIVIKIVDDEDDNVNEVFYYDGISYFPKECQVKLPIEEIFIDVESGSIIDETTLPQKSPCTEDILCTVCGELITKYGLNKHMMAHDEGKQSRKSKELDPKIKYTCESCNFICEGAYEYGIHNFTHTLHYKCPMCKFSSKCRSSLFGHIKRHEGQFKYHCGICGRGFIGKALLATHEEIHLDIKRYTCELCGKKFSVKRYLHVHRQLNHKKELYGIEQNYKCNVCGREFTFEKSLRRHQSTIHRIGEDRTVQCPVCYKTIANNYNLKAHMRTHTGEKNYCCDLCGKVFSAYKYWNKHKLIHERKKEKNILEDINDNIKIDSIGLVNDYDNFENSFQMYNNIKIEDESETDASKYSPKPRTRKGRGKKAIGGKTKVSTEKKASKKYVHKLKPNQKARSWCCKICFEEFATRKYLEGHRRTFHEDNEYVLFNEDEIKYSFDEIHEFYTCNNCSAEFQTKDEVEKHVETHEEKYECQVCCDVVHGALNFSSHMQLHREDKNYPCPLCPHIASRKSAMLTHISRLHFRKYDFQCRTCGKCFNDATTFKEHESFHLGVKPFNCLVCGKEFVYSRYLIAHQIRNHRVRVLDKDSKTQCHMCTKIFARSETLVKHMLTKHLTYHEGPHEKKHLCDVCGQGFSRTDKLKIHYRKHTGEKPYSCVYCSKSFIKRDYLIMHERIHNGEKPYVCDYCGKSFNQGAPLRIHMRSHTGERPYKCPHCQTGCVSKGALNAHIKSCLNSF